MYDWWLGGAHNFAVDREAAQQVLDALPEIRQSAQDNRSFLHRAVRYLIRAGVRQFLDLGSGIPTVGNVHEVAQQLAPESRVVYADIDPVAVATSQQLLDGNDHATAVQQDIRDPDSILDDPKTRVMLDFDRPIGLLLVAVLHYVPDQNGPYAIVSRLRQALCPGSFLVISHGTDDEQPARIRRVQELYKQTTTPASGRTRAEVLRFFDGLDLVEPGLVWAPLWRPDGDDDEPGQPDQPTDPTRSMSYVAVGRLP